jgi:hypothetical protein
MTFMDDLAPRLASRVQLTSDGHKPYLEAIEGAFGGDIDYAMLVKVYGAAPEGQRRYSPAICTGAHTHDQKKRTAPLRTLPPYQLVPRRRTKPPARPSSLKAAKREFVDEEGSSHHAAPFFLNPKLLRQACHAHKVGDAVGWVRFPIEKP